MKPVAIEYDKTLFLSEGRHILKDKEDLGYLTEKLHFHRLSDIRTMDEHKDPWLMILPLINCLLPEGQKLTKDDIASMSIYHDHMKIEIAQSSPYFMGSFKLGLYIKEDEVKLRDEKFMESLLEKKAKTDAKDFDNYIEKQKGLKYHGE